MRLLAAALSLAALAASSQAAAPERATWDFVVRLDGRVIGSHRFTLHDEAAGLLRVESDARFDVTVLGWTVYRYRHRSREVWQGGCLATIDASTDDDGKRTDVHGARGTEGFLIEGTASPGPACLMSFAYWNERLKAQQRLLDPGTGRIVPVDIKPLRGTRGWRVAGLPNAIDVLWDAERWTGLDTTVDGRSLTYRLQ